MTMSCHPSPIDNSFLENTNAITTSFSLSLGSSSAFPPHYSVFDCSPFAESWLRWGNDWMKSSTILYLDSTFALLSRFSISSVVYRMWRHLRNRSLSMTYLLHRSWSWTASLNLMETVRHHSLDGENVALIALVDLIASVKVGISMTVYACWSVIEVMLISPTTMIGRSRMMPWPVYDRRSSNPEVPSASILNRCMIRSSVAGSVSRWNCAGVTEAAQIRSTMQSLL